MRLKIKLLSLAALPIIGLFVLVGHSQAASGVIYVSPSSASVQVGHTITVSMRINPGATVTAVQAELNYNSAYLRFDNSSGGAFPICSETPSSGNATFACANTGGTSSDSLIGSVTFTALAGSGSTSLSISGAKAVSSGAYIYPSASGGTIRFTSPAAAAPKRTASATHTYTSSTSSSSPQPSTTNAPKKPTAPAPTVNIKTNVSNVGYTMAKINVTTNVATKDYVQYGTTSNNLSLKSSTSASGTSATISLPSGTINPATTYYYQLIAQDSGGNTTKGSVSSFTTKGYTVLVTVLDSNDRPVNGKVVSLHSKVMTATTNSKGIATFYNVAPGVHHVEYALSKNKNFTSTIYVSNDFTTSGDNQSAPNQDAAALLTGFVQPKASTSSNSNILLLIVVAAAAGIATALLLNKPLKNKLKRRLSAKVKQGDNLIRPEDEEELLKNETAENEKEEASGLPAEELKDNSDTVEDEHKKTDKSIEENSEKPKKVKNKSVKVSDQNK